MLKTCYPEITHELDLWHLSKSLMKKFKTKNKKYEEVWHGNNRYVTIYGGRLRIVTEILKY